MSRLKNYQELNQHSMSKSGSTSKRASCCQQHCCRLKKHLVLVLACQTLQNCAEAQPQKLCNWFSNCLLEEPLGDNRQGHKLGLKLKLCSLINTKALSALKSLFQVQDLKNISELSEKSDTWKRKIWQFKKNLTLQVSAFSDTILKCGINTLWSRSRGQVLFSLSVVSWFSLIFCNSGKT